VEKLGRAGVGVSRLKLPARFSFRKNPGGPGGTCTLARRLILPVIGRRFSSVKSDNKSSIRPPFTDISSVWTVINAGRSLRFRCRKLTPSATHPGGKYVLRKLRIWTVRANRSCSALATACCVYGQLQANTITTMTAMTMSDAPMISHKRLVLLC